MQCHEVDYEIHGDDMQIVEVELDPIQGRASRHLDFRHGSQAADETLPRLRLEEADSEAVRARVDRDPITSQYTSVVVQGTGFQRMESWCAPQVDLVFGPQTYHRLPELLAKVERERAGTDGPGRGILATEFPVESKFDHLPEAAAPQGPSAFLSIQEGCDKFCTFCVVPYTRGAEFSRPAGAVIAEAERLAGAGAREITLLGQPHVNLTCRPALP